MTKSPINKIVQEWFRLATIDLIGAKSLYDLKNEKLWSLVAYHCQQVVEKSIKGYLAYQKIKFNKTHDIGELAHLVLVADSSLDFLLKEADQLTPYAISIRYPDAALKELEKTDVEFALEIALKVYNAILSKITFDGSWSL